MVLLQLNKEDEDSGGGLFLILNKGGVILKKHLLDYLYDFGSNPNTGSNGQGKHPYTKKDKLAKFKKDLKTVFHSIKKK